MVVQRSNLESFRPWESETGQLVCAAPSVLSSSLGHPLEHTLSSIFSVHLTVMARAQGTVFARKDSVGRQESLSAQCSVAVWRRVGACKAEVESSAVLSQGLRDEAVRKRESQIVEGGVVASAVPQVVAW